MFWPIKSGAARRTLKEMRETVGAALDIILERDLITAGELRDALTKKGFAPAEVNFVAMLISFLDNGYLVQLELLDPSKYSDERCIRAAQDIANWAEAEARGEVKFTWADRRELTTLYASIYATHHFLEAYEAKKNKGKKRVLP